MRSPEFSQPKARSARESQAGLGAAIFGAVMSVACERIPPGPPVFHTAIELLATQGTPHTPEGVLDRTLHARVEGQEQPATQFSVLSFEGSREPGTHIHRFIGLARTHYGHQNNEPGVAGPYFNFVIVPGQAASPRELNGQPVEVSFEVARTDVFSSNDNTKKDVRVGAIISQNTELHRLNEQPTQGGQAHDHGTVLAHQEATGPDYTTALGMALNRIIAPPERNSEIQADFARQRAAADAQHDPNHGERCGTITSPMMPNSYYCEIRTRRSVRIVIDDVNVQDTPGGIRVSVMYYNPNTTARNVLAIPGI